MRALRGLLSFSFILLSIEFLDELIFGAGEAAWPLIRDDLSLNYIQIGALLALPRLFSGVIEPFLGILADTSRRRALILGGGLILIASLALTAASGSFLPLLISFLLYSPASGAFVSLSQAALMDAEPARHEQNMARWTFAGSLGVVAGPLALGAAYLFGADWRGLFLVFALLALLIWLLARRYPFPAPVEAASPPRLKETLSAGLRQAFAALRRGEVLRWLILLEFGDLMLDVLLGFLALYMVDAAGATQAQAGLAVGVWTVSGLIGDLLLIPLLERFPGIPYLRLSALLEFLLFSAFLLTPSYPARLVLLALLGLFNSGWYAILRSRLYTAMPGRSGLSLTVDNLAGLIGGLLPLGLSWVAQEYNIQAAMGLMLLGPLALLIGLPRGAPLQKVD
ncbi:MAG: MFS transporter [Chloroflexi bacterium]|nr:MFS transporter [Chloroflexota bacterium]